MSSCLGAKKSGVGRCKCSKPQSSLPFGSLGSPGALQLGFQEMMGTLDNQQNLRSNLQRRRLQPTKEEMSTKRELLLQPAKCGCLQTRCKQNKGSEQQMREKHKKKLRIRQTKWMCWPTKTRLWISLDLSDTSWHQSKKGKELHFERLGWWFGLMRLGIRWLHNQFHEGITG